MGRRQVPFEYSLTPLTKLAFASSPIEHVMAFAKYPVLRKKHFEVTVY